MKELTVKQSLLEVSGLLSETEILGIRERLHNESPKLILETAVTFGCLHYDITVLCLRLCIHECHQTAQRKQS